MDTDNGGNNQILSVDEEKNRREFLKALVEWRMSRQEHTLTQGQRPLTSGSDVCTQTQHTMKIGERRSKHTYFEQLAINQLGKMAGRQVSKEEQKATQDEQDNDVNCKKQTARTLSDLQTQNENSQFEKDCVERRQVEDQLDDDEWLLELIDIYSDNQY
eukprot:TRINITY_DN127884_c0_g1_i1.p4 TRINITY_DN127884_c0_g1~~TRINITY_DN127884_c0_g1_i1.p4  ORF type:complete len:159 (+),score=24.80 TRINITY_DN127884_c0_g1_i1:331-807(+)